MKKAVLYVLALFLVCSCASKKNTIKTKEIIVKDTVTITKEKRVIKPLSRLIFIEDPCDSLGGLKPFNNTIVTEIADIRLSNYNGNIQLSVNIDSIVNTRVEEFKKNFIKENETLEIEVIKYKIPFWVWVYIVLSVVIIILLFRFR